MKNMKFIVKTDGDPSVGIAGDEATVIVDVEQFDAATEADFIVHVKEHLAIAFRNIWDFDVNVFSEIDLANMNKADEL
jgi:hypothetical protein